MANTDELAARLLHLRSSTLEKGEPVAPPLSVSSMFHLPGDPSGSAAYGRIDNATWETCEAALALLESAPTVLFPSGMAAIAAPFLSLLKSGDTILVPSDGYYVTRLLADNVLGRLGVTVKSRPTSDFEDGGFDGFRMVFVETPSNPGLDLCNLKSITTGVRNAGGISVVDNTTMTPFGQRPMDLGADIVVAADTKAPGGHSDLLLGHVSTRDPDILTAVKEWRKISGAIPGGLEAWLLYRSLETLELRFDRMCRSAEVIATRLAEEPAIRRLRYPGLPGDPAHNLAKEQMHRFGFLIGIDLGTEDRAERFINSCPLIQPATSFGGVHSSAERRARWGDAVGPGYVRLSVGCEPTEALWRAIEASLSE